MKTELGIIIATKTEVKVKPEHARQLLDALKQSETGRMSAAELALLIFGKNTEAAKRRVRAVARHLRPRVVSFPGSDGYSLWKRCPVDDIWHAIYAMEASGKDQLTEAMEFRKALHSGYRGEMGDEVQVQLPLTQTGSTS